MPFENGTWIFDNGFFKFKIVIPSTAAGDFWVSLDAPKAIPLTELFNPSNWTEET